VLTYYLDVLAAVAVATTFTLVAYAVVRFVAGSLTGALKQQEVVSYEGAADLKKLRLKLKNWFTWSVSINQEKGVAGGNVKIDFPFQSGLLLAALCFGTAVVIGPVSKWLTPGIFMLFGIYHLARWWRSLRVLENARAAAVGAEALARKTAEWIQGDAAGGPRITVVQAPPQLLSGLEYAGMLPRLAAALIDVGLYAMFAIPLMIMTSGSADASAGDALIHIFILCFCPFTATLWFWRYKLATPGKMIIRARILDAELGTAPSTKQLAIRYVGYFLSLPFGIGFLVAVYDRRRQTLHDKIAGTVVVREVLPAAPVVFAGIPAAATPRPVAETPSATPAATSSS
jgi:uncharacterized RDD family membrane protein YckC